jgi:hypothetical protein
MVTKKGGDPILDPLPDPIKPPKPIPVPLPEYPPVPVVTGLKRSMQRNKVEGGMVRQTVIRSAKIATGRNARLRSADLKERLGLDDTRMNVTETGLVEMSDDLAAVDTKAKYTLSPLTNGAFKLVSVSMPIDVVPGATDIIAEQRLYTPKSIEAAVEVIKAKQIVLDAEISEVSI